MSDSDLNNDNQQLKLDDSKTKSYYHKKHSDYSKYYYGKYENKMSISNRIVNHLILYDDIKQKMLPFGYNEEKIQNFAKVQQEANECSSNQAKLHGDKVCAYADFKKLFDTAQKEFRFVLKVAKVALRDELKKVEKLKLFAKRGKAIDDIFAFMDSFYTQSLDDSEILVLMATYGYPIDRLKSCQGCYLSAKTAYLQYNTACAESNEATRIQKQKIAELDAWMSEYYALVKVADEQR